MLAGKAHIIGEDNTHVWLDPPAPDGKGRKRGLIPRNYEKTPLGFYAGIPSYKAVQMPLIPRSEWPARLKALKEAGALLSDHRRRGMKGKKPIPSRDQDGRGYCWIHSGVSIMLVCRARDGQPYVDLSAYAGACQIKNFRDEGGWGAQGVDWLIKNGCPTSKTWPQRSVARSNVTEAMKQESLLYRIDEGWIDLESAQYNRNLAWEQIVTCALSGHPWISDHNWWSHSIAGLDVVDGVALFNETIRDEESGKKVTLQEFHKVWDMNDPVTAGLGSNIWNSWGDSWSNNGEGYLPPSKCVPDGSVAVRSVTLAA